MGRIANGSTKPSDELQPRDKKQPIRKTRLLDDERRSTPCAYQAQTFLSNVPDEPWYIEMQETRFGPGRPLSTIGTWTLRGPTYQHHPNMRSHHDDHHRRYRQQTPKILHHQNNRQHLRHHSHCQNKL